MTGGKKIRYTKKNRAEEEEHEWTIVHLSADFHPQAVAYWRMENSVNSYFEFKKQKHL